MKRILLICMVLLPVWTGFGQNYSIDWFTIDGGGGTSTGGGFSVSGTIGQPDAGATLSGGSYTVDGGFWGIIAAVQTPGAPLLTIRLTGTNTVVISWPSQSAGFTLYKNADLNTVNWTEVGGLIGDDGSTKTVIINPPVGNGFYRLSNP